MAQAKHPDPDSGPIQGHEPSDLKPRAIVVFLVLLGVMIVGVLVVSAWIHEYSAARLARMEAPPSPLAKQAPPAEPRLQVFAPRQMQEFRAAEEATLNSYDWVNRAAGVVRIPIDRAMQLLAERGLPAAGGKSPPAKGERR